MGISEIAAAYVNENGFDEYDGSEPDVYGMNKNCIDGLLNMFSD